MCQGYKNCAGASCLHCHPQEYIRMVHHLIERCLLLQMSKEQCVKTLEEHANISPLVTLTVWKELQKENTEFFQHYHLSNDSSKLTGDNVRELLDCQDGENYRNKKPSATLKLATNFKSL